MGRIVGMLSPQLLNGLQNRNPEPAYNPFKADVFSMGMTLLEAGTMSNVAMCYNESNFTLNTAQIQVLLGQLSQRYTSGFVNIVNQMLQNEESLRPSWAQLLE
jgi:hypothetical protein